MRIFHSIRFRLFFWFVGSQLLLVLYFLLFIHFYTIKYNFQILLGLFFFEVVIGFFIIRHIVYSLNSLTQKMKSVNSRNLDEKILGLENEGEIGELAFSFNSLLERLHAAFVREQQFIADLAHEMKTPLSVMKSSFDVDLNKKRNIDEYEKTLKNASREVDKMSGVLQKVLDLAWVNTQNEENINQKINLNELMGEILELTEKMAISKQIKVKNSFVENVFVYGFKDKLARAIINLIENAVKYTPENGKITILLEKSNKKVFIQIKDSGIGIAREDIPFIFNRFYRGTSSAKILGNGLGLAIVKSIIQLHKGSIRVMSNLHQGSVFIIELPAE